MPCNRSQPSVELLDEYEWKLVFAMYDKLAMFIICMTKLANADWLRSVQLFCQNKQNGGKPLKHSALTTNFHILVSRGRGWLGISQTIKF